MRKNFLIDCELDYDVATQTVFIFHIAIPDDANQRVLQESTGVFPDAPTDEFRDPSGANRFIRIDAQPGPFTIRYIEYRVGSSTLTTTAQDVLANKAGVCRDFAHLAIAFCRALNIPARLMTGYARYAEPPADFHAVFEAYLGERWYLFDPTRLSKLDEIVRIDTGIDASEAAFATFFGNAGLRRLSPLIEPQASARSGSRLVSLQRPDSGTLLAA